MAPPSARRRAHPVWSRVADALQAVACWTIWVALGLVAMVQVYVISSREFALPRFLAEALEARLTASGLQATFGSTHFDPAGRLLVENLRVRLPGFEEPVAEARAVYIRLDPWALLTGRFAPIEERATGLTLRVPAMLSPSGRADEIIRDADLEVLPADGRFDIPCFSAWVGPLAVAGHGSVRLSPGRAGNRGPLPGAQWFAQHYPQWSRAMAAELGRLKAFEQPRLALDFVAPEQGAGSLTATFRADAVKLDEPVVVEARGIAATGGWNLAAGAGGLTDLTLEIRQANVAGTIRLGAVAAVAHGVGWIQDGSGGRPVAGLVQLCADQVATAAGVIVAPSVEVDCRHYPKLGGAVAARLWDQLVSVRGDVDLERRAGRAEIAAVVGPGVLEFLRQRMGWDLRPYVQLTHPVDVAGLVSFGPGWRFERVDGRVAAEGVTALGVRVDSARGRIAFDGRRLVARDAFAQVGDNYARGTFEDDIAQGTYRFLLDGRLRPLDITPWIDGDWWPALFGNFDFAAAPPTASADVRGSWTDGRQSAVFVNVDAPGVAVRGVRFDDVRTRIFARPQFVEALDLTARQGDGEAAGSFTRRYDLAADDWQSVDVAVTSTLDLGAIGRLLGPDWASALTPFAFRRPPHVVFRGRFTGPAAAEGAHQTFRAEVRSDGPFLYHDFPLDRVAFVANVRDDAVALTDVDASVAGGAMTGQATVTGAAPNQKLRFAADLKNARLWQAVAILDDFSARQAGRKPTADNRFIQGRTDVLLDLALQAQGSLSNAYDFQGGGTAYLRGGEITQVRMLGLLSELFRFTALRFTTARAVFRLDGPQVIFSDIDVTGANSAIRADGTYRLDRHQLDVRARVDPFEQSRSFPQKFVDGFFFTPLSNLLEVRLTGTIEKPKWIFANGPAGLLRNLGAAPKTPAAAGPLLQ